MVYLVFLKIIKGQILQKQYKVVFCQVGMDKGNHLPIREAVINRSFKLLHLQFSRKFNKDGYGVWLKNNWLIEIKILNFDPIPNKKLTLIFYIHHPLPPKKLWFKALHFYFLQPWGETFSKKTNFTGWNQYAIFQSCRTYVRKDIYI